MLKKIVIGMLILGCSKVYAEQPKFIYPFKVGNYYEYTYEESSLEFRYSAKVESDTIINGFKYQKFKYTNKPPFGERTIYYYFDTLSLNLYSFNEGMCLDTNNNSLIVGFNLPIGYQWNGCDTIGTYIRSIISDSGAVTGFLNYSSPLRYAERQDTIGDEFQANEFSLYIEKFGFSSICGFGGIFTGNSYCRILKGAIIDGITYGSILLDVNQISIEIPNVYKLEQNYPNPFNPSTLIKFSIHKSSFVSLKVYDQLGKEVSILVNEKKSAGSYQYVFNANDISSGIYYYILQAGDFVETKRMVLLK